MTKETGPANDDAKANAAQQTTVANSDPVSSSIILTSGIHIREVRVRFFRCLRSVDVVLDQLTLLVGQNNSGKTSFLNAIFAAIGAGQRTIFNEDIFLYRNEVYAPKDREVVIDILIRPADEKGQMADVFPQGSPWLELWGNGVVQDEEDRDLVAVRTFLKWSSIKGEYLLERRFLKDWQVDGAKWQESKPLERVPPLTLQQTEPLALYFLDAKRDISEDLHSKSSFWSKMIEEHGLTPKDVARIEKELSNINKDIVQSSDVFTHIQSHLRDSHETLSCDEDSIAITPLARHLRDLSRGMDVILSTRGAPAFPVRRQGMGTRSLGTFFTFWAFTTWRQKQAKTGPMHPLMAMEEPEAHLHPQAQRALFRQIRKMPGQRIISTHSPYICGQAEIAQIRHFSKTGEETVVCRLDLGTGDSALSADDLRKIDREVMNTRGDLLFARSLVMFEGETEEQALPDFAENHWKKHPNDLGLSFIGVGGSGKYLPFLRLAESFKIPWFIFSDGEASAIEAVNVSLAAVNQTHIPNNPRVIVLPEGKNFEKYIVTAQTKDRLIEAIIQHRMKSSQHKEALNKEWAGKPEDEQIEAVIGELDENKTLYGSMIGKILPVPNAIQELFQKVQSELMPTELKEKLGKP